MPLNSPLARRHHSKINFHRDRIHESPESILRSLLRLASSNFPAYSPRNYITNYATNRRGPIFDRIDQQILRSFLKRIIVIVKFVLIEDRHWNLLFIVEMNIIFFFFKNICVYTWVNNHIHTFLHKVIKQMKFFDIASHRDVTLSSNM